jgi:hypothetical protein
MEAVEVQHGKHRRGLKQELESPYGRTASLARLFRGKAGVGAAYKLGTGRPWFDCRGHVRHFCQSHWSSLDDRGARPTRSERAFTGPEATPLPASQDQVRQGTCSAAAPAISAQHPFGVIYCPVSMPCLFHSFCTRGTGRQTQRPGQDRGWHMAFCPGRAGRDIHRPAEEPQSIPRAGAADLIPVYTRFLHFVPVLRPDPARQTEVSGVPGRLTLCGHRESLSRHLRWRPFSPAPTFSIRVTLVHTRVTALERHFGGGRHSGRFCRGPVTGAAECWAVRAAGSGEHGRGGKQDCPGSWLQQGVSREGVYPYTCR